MNIIYLHQYFTTPEFAGGSRSYQFAKRMVAEGHQVDMITSTAFFHVKRERNFQLISRIQVDGINVHAIHVAYGNNMSFLCRIWAFTTFMLIASIYILSLRKKDIIYATSTPLTIGVPALIGKKLLGLPLLFEVRDLWPDIPIDMGYIKNRILIKLLRLFEKLIYHQATKIIVLSPGMKVEIVAKGIPSDKINIIPNACDIDEFAKTSEVNPLRKFRETESTKICIYSGTFGVVNNLQYIVNLAEALRTVDPEIHFILVGDGSEKELLKKLIYDKNLTDRVHLLNSVTKSELVPYIQNADVCISTVKNIPSLFNNSANKFFDAFAAGKPIIINHPGWLADIINKNNLGVVLDYDYERSAHKLSCFLRDNNENYNSKMARIREFGQQNYGRELLYRKLMNVIQTLPSIKL